MPPLEPPSREHISIRIERTIEFIGRIEDFYHRGADFKRGRRESDEGGRDELMSMWMNLSLFDSMLSVLLIRSGLLSSGTRHEEFEGFSLKMPRDCPVLWKSQICQRPTVGCSPGSWIVEMCLSCFLSSQLDRINGVESRRRAGVEKGSTKVWLCVMRRSSMKQSQIANSLIKTIQSPEKHFAKQLRRAMVTGDSQEVLIRMLVTRSGIDIKNIDSAFSEKTGWSLESLIRNEFNCSSHENSLGWNASSPTFSYSTWVVNSDSSGGLSPEIHSTHSGSTQPLPESDADDTTTKIVTCPSSTQMFSGCSSEESSLGVTSHLSDHRPIAFAEDFNLSVDLEIEARAAWDMMRRGRLNLDFGLQTLQYCQRDISEKQIMLLDIGAKLRVLRLVLTSSCF
ncbi:hypothetical protein M5K25_023057 [Dendrobium thyrsiflorum]|uniref:Uncharacterized protein n=1 Tax=Dendrobium thyrsiflorum TaxID=117978 RepID=A0ABD0UE57_DENTH